MADEMCGLVAGEAGVVPLARRAVGVHWDQRPARAEEEMNLRSGETETERDHCRVLEPQMATATAKSSREARPREEGTMPKGREQVRAVEELWQLVAGLQLGVGWQRLPRT
jgi:hypothetical protein